MSDSAIEVFDHSMIAGYRACPAKFGFRYRQHLVPKGQREYKAAFGSAGHEALSSYYKGGGTQEMDKAFINYWLPYEGLDNTGARCMARGLTIMKQYREQYPIDREPFRITSPELIEVGLSTELGDYIYCGKVDGIVKWRLGFEGYVILEHKFSGKKGYLTVKPNHQLDGYIFAAQELLGEPIIGAHFNQIYFEKKAVDGNDFIRELTSRDPETDIADWKQSTIDWMDEINRACKSGYFRKNTSNCGAFFRQCEYHKLCVEHNPTRRDNLIEQFYERVEWNPYPDARNHVELE